jgi:hypothetical protein
VKSKERGFKQGFKEDFRSKVLKNCKGGKALKNREKKK